MPREARRRGDASRDEPAETRAERRLARAKDERRGHGDRGEAAILRRSRDD